MAPPLSNSQKKRRNKKLKSKHKGDDIKPEADIPEFLTAHTAVAEHPDGQCEATTNELEDRLEETIVESDPEDTKTSSSVVKLVNERIMLQNKKASLFALYTLKSPSELDEYQRKSVATLPIIQANIKELKELRKAIKSMEVEEAELLERKNAEDEKARRERTNEAISDAKELYLNRVSNIISLIHLSAHLRSPGPSPSFPLNPNAHHIIQRIGQILIGFSGSQKHEALSGLLKSEGQFEGLAYSTILFIAELYRNSQIVEELTKVPESVKDQAELEPNNAAVDQDDSLKADSGQEGQSDRDIPEAPSAGSESMTPTHASNTTNVSSEKTFEGTVETTTEREDLASDNMKIQAKLEELRCKLAELEREKQETARKREEEEQLRHAELEELGRKLERDRLLWQEVARKREEEEIRLEESKQRLANLERERLIWEEVLRKRMHEEGIEESKRKLKKMEEDRLLWEETARKRKEEELCRKEEERVRLEKEKWQAAERKRQEEQKLKQQAQEREKKKEERRSQMTIKTVEFQTPGNSKWTVESLLERYMCTATRFDSTTYTVTNPLKFRAIPWPVAYRAFSVESITWEAVENFFKLMEEYLSDEEYINLVDKSHKRFHPDRWRSRKILTSIKDELEREILEEAGNTVAQAITPLWKHVTGRE